MEVDEDREDRRNTIIEEVKEVVSYIIYTSLRGCQNRNKGPYTTDEGEWLGTWYVARYHPSA